MKIRLIAALTAALILPLPPCVRAPKTAEANTPPLRYAGPATVEIEQLVTSWHDEARNRDVPAKIFTPRAGGPFPLLILSHGLGGSRDGLDYLGRFWAQRGYVCAQIQHVGTDESVWKNAKSEAEAETSLKRAGGNIENILNRPRDVSFSIDQLLTLGVDENSPLKGKINADGIGVAGHSLGGLTALLSAGQRAMAGEFALDLSDPRIKASVSMSSPLNPNAPLAAQFAQFKIPNFYLVGAKDNNVLGATIAQRQIYDAIAAPDQYLLIIGGADHMALGGQRFGPDLSADAATHALVQQATLAFWDAELKGDGMVKSWLKDGFKNQLGADSEFQNK